MMINYKLIYFLISLILCFIWLPFFGPLAVMLQDLKISPLYVTYVALLPYILLIGGILCFTMKISVKKSYLLLIILNIFLYVSLISNSFISIRKLSSYGPCDEEVAKNIICALDKPVYISSIYDPTFYWIKSHNDAEFEKELIQVLKKNRLRIIKQKEQDIDLPKTEQ